MGESGAAAHRPLSGIRVLDLTNVLAGPFCCHQLAHLGADVVKVEAPSGDLARQLGQDEALSAAGMGISFLAPNAGKRSIALDLKTPGGRRVLERLARGADVLVENFRPGVMERLGVGPERLREINPRLIYCAISGFGRDGAMSGRPAYDQIVQGLSGAMAITGSEESGPLRAGWPVADTVGGLTAAMAVCAALNAWPRGCLIDVSMLDSLMATMGWAVSNLLVGGVHPRPAGNENLTSAPSAAYACADGLLNIAANEQAQWERLARHLGLERLLDDPRFATRLDRKRNRNVLNGLIGAALSTKTAAEWERELSEIGVPAGRVLDLEEALEHPRARDQIARYDVAGREVELMRTGLHIDGEAPSVEAPPPTLAEHAEEILGEAGFDAAEVAALREEGAI